MSETPQQLLTALLALSVAAGASIGVAAGASSGSLSAAPSEPGATATHTATATAGNGTAGSWNGFSVEYPSGSDVSDVGQDDIVKIGIDRGDDASGDTIDVNVSDDLSDVKVSDNGQTLTVKLGGSYELKAGDEVVVVYENAVNPSEAGSYEVPLDINPQSSGGETTATFEVGSSSGEDTTQDDSTTESSDSTTESDATTAGNDSGSGGSPGFGLAVALAAVVGAALFGLRN